MSEVEISKVLDQMRAMAAQAQGGAGEGGIQQTQGPEFGDLLKRSVEAVNETQQQAGKLSEAFHTGDPNVDLTDVMIALQKASVSFQAMTQVRNKLVDAYQEIMRMQA